MIIGSVGALIRDRPLYATVCDASIVEACRQLGERRIGALVVLDCDKLVGIISERDVVSRVIARERDPRTTLVREVMTRDPTTIGAADSLADALRVMIERRFRHLPVVQGDSVVGMISMRDIPTVYRLMYQRFREAHETTAALKSDGSAPTASARS